MPHDLLTFSDAAKLVNVKLVDLYTAVGDLRVKLYLNPTGRVSLKEVRNVFGSSKKKLNRR